jgi:hypothetical protein
VRGTGELIGPQTSSVLVVSMPEEVCHHFRVFSSESALRLNRRLSSHLSLVIAESSFPWNHEQRNRPFCLSLFFLRWRSVSLFLRSSEIRQCRAHELGPLALRKTRRSYRYGLSRESQSSVGDYSFAGCFSAKNGHD